MTKPQLNTWRTLTWVCIIGLTIAFWTSVIILVKEIFFATAL